MLLARYKLLYTHLTLVTFIPRASAALHTAEPTEKDGGSVRMEF